MDVINKALRSIARRIRHLGLNPRVLSSFKNYPLYRKQKKEWLQKGGKITHNHMILHNYTENSGTAKGHYFHQDLLVAGFISKKSPDRHIDVGSSVEGFVAHVASFREIEIVDIRPLAESEHKNIKFVQADFMRTNSLGQTDSLSCLHAIEHFGLGRYSDPIDVQGYVKGINNLVSLVAKGGRLYISFPIGLTDEVHFNAHRVFHPKSIFSIPSIETEMNLVRFDYVDDNGKLHLNSSIEEVDGNVKYGCGIYTFQKI
jgi:hypothetical protein